jgi:thiol:disulfide interchange protein
MNYSVPTRRSSGAVTRSLLAAALLAFVSQSVFAQGFNLSDSKRGIGFSTGGSASRALKIETSLTADRLEAGAVATLTVKATLPQGFHLYSMSEGYVGRTRIELAETPGLTPLGDFRADRQPKRIFDETLNQELEEFTGQVAWTREMRIVDPAIAKISGKFIGTYCSSGTGGQCFRANETLSASLTQIDAPPPAAGAAAAAFSSVESPLVGNKPGPVTLRFSLAPEHAQPGETVTLNATMTLDDGWHTYAVTQPHVPGARPTVFALKKSQGLTPIGDVFVADKEPQQRTLETSDGQSSLQEHAGSVTWSRQFRVDDAAYGIEGTINYVTCRDQLCNQPKTVAFALGALDQAGEVPAALPAPKTDSLAKSFKTEDSGTANLPLYLGLAFLGGLILNVMPCVLPVVAIKVMSFMHQAGESRSRVFLLNAVYAAGVVSVFLLLAALAALPQSFGWLFSALGLETGGFGWGGLFQSDAFNLVMACLVFAMGLSLLGVFEIPIPGMVGSAAGASHREGLAGAFATGIFATLLATPCTGPFVGSTLAWSVKQPVAVTFLVWGMMGLGMASPYLVFGLVPGAVKLLPKPGAWMVQFKEFAGLVLMGTVIWLVSSLNTKHLLPLLIILLGISFAFWLIGTVQPSPSATKRRVVSVIAVLLGLGIGGVGYYLTLEPTHKLAWEPFSTQRVNALRDEGKPFLIDFTADWCANCKVNERIALNRAETKAFVEKHRITTLIADYDGSPEVKEWLDRFGREGIPLTVIFPAGRPNDPILLDGVYSQGTLLESLAKAVKPEATASAPVKSATVR